MNLAQVVLSLFPGIGMLDHAFEQEGYCVVRGPDPLWGGDIRRFHPPSRFDGIIGGPPCQTFSSLSNLVRARGNETHFGNLIPEFERCVVEAIPSWFLMENVPAAPNPIIPGYGITSFLLDNASLAGEDGFGQEQRRQRRFSFGLFGRKAPSLLNWIDLATFILPTAGTVTSNDGGRSVLKTTVTTTYQGDKPNERTLKSAVCAMQGTPSKRKDSSRIRAGRYKLPEACRLQGLPVDFLDDSPFTAEGKLKAIANGVPIPMARAISRAILQALEVL